MKFRFVNLKRNFMTAWGESTELLFSYTQLRHTINLAQIGYMHIFTNRIDVTARNAELSAHVQRNDGEN